MNFVKSVILVVFSIASVAHADDSKLIRWTGTDDSNPSLSHVLQVIEKKTGKHYQASDFLLQEGIPLAFSRYERYEQMAGNIPLEGKSIRIWTDSEGKYTIQVEAMLEDPAVSQAITKAESREALMMAEGGVKKSVMSDQEAAKIALAEVRADAHDANVRGMDFKDSYAKGRLVRTFTIKGKYGKHIIQVGFRSRKVLKHEYKEFPTADEVQLDAMVYPIYEETEAGSVRLDRAPRTLNHIQKWIPQATGDIYAPLKQSQYFYSKYSFTKGATLAGRSQGFWSMNYLKQQAAEIRRELPTVANTFENGLLLQGAYATINIHPDAYNKFSGVNYTPVNSTAFYPNTIPTADGSDYEMIPTMAFGGKPIQSPVDILLRPARRLQDHDPASYMNDGFDEIQVYYAVDTLVETLRSLGYTDPELSTRPFNAFLYTPGMEYRDNAFYTDDTINFTTYSPKAQNYARDNSTIWHELGHGVMDRLMGDNIVLADTGGLAEGMADFVAAMVIQGVTDGVPFPGSNAFRIINKTSFFMTNESHDDGEAYGGSMKDFMDSVIKRDGSKVGLPKVVDVILEAMRLSRDHPALTAPDWFGHILFADSLGRPGVRAPNELHDLIVAALAGRNFRLDGGDTATFKIYGDKDQHEIVAGVVGSRAKPIQVNIAKDQTAEFDVSAVVKSAGSYQFQYPLTIRASYKGSALQGAVHWVGKENGPQLFTLNSEADAAKFHLSVTGTCDYVNRDDGSCVDYVSVQVVDPNDVDHPKAKKRFYVQIKNPN